ncbi:MAG TPA: SRPBCC family protein, partial [Chitinophagales bacterium]|nr:SRPBCC family protein [Chitinophagales bacterium]
MKIFGRILIALAVIAVIAGIVIYFLPKEYKTAESVEINKPVNVVYAEISDFSQWNKWSPWYELEPSEKVTVSGAPGQAGHKMCWEGNKTGTGCMELNGAETDKTVDMSLHFIKPFEATAQSHFVLEGAGGKTKITWVTTGGLPFPIGRLMGSSIDKNLHKDMAHGL